MREIFVRRWHFNLAWQSGKGEAAQMTADYRLNEMGKNLFNRFFSTRIENSLRLRVLVLASLWLGAIGVAWVGGDLRLTLLGGGLGTLGYLLSWRLRHRPSLVRSLLIATAVIAVSFYMRSQLLSVFNGNWLPAAHLLIIVQGLASFESRSRGGLYAGLVLSGSVLFFASQQAFEPSFGIFVVGFIVVLLAFLTMAFLEDGIRGAQVHWAQGRRGRSAMLPYWIGIACAVFILSGLAFWVMPRGELSLVGPSQLSVLPYSGESLGEEYQSPQVNPDDLASLFPLEEVAGPAQNRSDEEAARRGLDEGSEASSRGGRLLGGAADSETGAKVKNGAGDGLLSSRSSDFQGQAAKDSVLYVRTKVTSYWRGRALEHFQGNSWRTDSSQSYLTPSMKDPEVWFHRNNLNRSSRALYQQTFYVQGQDLDAIPTGYQPLRIGVLDGSLNKAGVEGGTVYRVLSAYPEHSPERLRQDSTWVGDRHLINIPSNLRQELHSLSSRITSGAASDFDKIERIVTYLREEGTFEPGWPQNPTAKAQLNEFLIQRHPGNAMDYATATAMLVLSQLGFGNCLRKRLRLLPFFRSVDVGGWQPWDENGMWSGWKGKNETSWND